MAVIPGNPILKADLDALAALANSKTTLPQYIAPLNPSGGSRPYSFNDWAGASQLTADNPQWLSELNRLRQNLNPLIFPSGQAIFTPALTSRSGPWPVNGPTSNFEATNFYYADTGHQESVTLTSQGPHSGSGPFTTTVALIWTPVENTPTNFQFGLFQTAIDARQIYTFVIGGIDALPCSGKIIVTGLWIKGFQSSLNFGPPTGGWTGSRTYDGVDPTSLLTVSGNMPVAPVITSIDPGGGGTPVVQIEYDINQSLPPGRYECIIDVQNLGDDTLDENDGGGGIGTTKTRVLFSTGGSSIVGMSGGLTGAFTYSNSVAAPGIHGTKNVLRINLPGDEIGVGAGIGSVIQLSDQAWLKSPFPQPVMGTEIIAVNQLSIATTVAGFWTAKTQRISNLNPIPASSMPWNFPRSRATGHGGVTVNNPMLFGDLDPTAQGVSNSYVQNTLVESQIEPPAWLANTWFTLGFTILDSNGNLQRVTTAGKSGAGHPAWSSAVGGTTADGTGSPKLTWTCKYVFRPADTWIANKTWNVGDTIIDANGNQQTAISTWQPGKVLTVGQFITDANNNTQQVITAGTTGAVAPAWSTLLNNTTNDNSVVWKFVLAGSSMVSAPLVEPVWSTALNGLTTDASVIWKLTKPAKPIIPAQRRLMKLPRYPFYWQTETLANLKPPTATSGLTIWGGNSQWQRNAPIQGLVENGWQSSNMAAGWFIYSVSLNRIGTNLKGSTLFQMQDSAGNPQQVAVTIGCIRNGAFVAFGTYNTGQTVQVLWPVFTSDALVYQCTERVEIQALALIGLVTTGVSVAGPPLAATFVSDVTDLLNLID